MDTFTSDWFSHNIPIWEQHVIEKLRPGPIRWLELGSYEGRSACWVHDNVIAARGGSLACVDVWYDKGYEARFDANVAGKTIEKIKSFTLQWLLENQGKRSFDVIYVDADHEAKSTLLDAAFSWTMLEPGGFMIFDDYVWEHPEPKGRVAPKAGIDAFVACWAHQLAVCHQGYQMIVRKLSAGQVARAGSSLEDFE